MGFFLFLIVVGAPFGVLILMHRWMQRHRAKGAIRYAFRIAAISGALFGIWLSFRFEYRAGPRTRVAGAPLPLVVFKLEGENWTDFPPDSPAIVVLAITNAAICAAALAGPVVLLFALRGKSAGTDP